MITTKFISLIHGFGLFSRKFLKGNTWHSIEPADIRIMEILIASYRFVLAFDNFLSLFLSRQTAKHTDTQTAMTLGNTRYQLIKFKMQYLALSLGDRSI